ncbi:hypothetical protein NM688_g7715 [Phlebia brevispora]|uniref:Uncharacterized protein n=1 Tax=Phlebia brevispora TaxID=194682 RepID=A0ACC1S1X4_9APHY|nr:hypothetical protein NM688_g7715 [Phlebia brevispora]
MFPRSNRFPSTKVSDVPGPGAYDPQDPEYDAYKHGAFLEKQDRFLKEKPSDVPGPSAYTTERCGNKRVEVKTVSGDRTAVLQRKLQEMERLYSESKKTHQAEVERLKGELSRAQRSNAEQNDRCDKLKKQNEVLDLRLSELKKINLSDQSEVKDLRVKLRLAEHERTQLASKQGDVGEAKKALQALDYKRREELRERDRRITDLEKSLATERKRKDGLESRLTEVKENANTELHQIQDSKKALDAALQEMKEEKERAKTSLLAFQTQAKDKEDELVAQLEQHRLLLSRVAEEYGRLASSTISLVEHERAKSQSRVLSLRVARLERKLANSEGQVLELANLIRCTKDQNAILTTQLVQAETAVSYYREALHSALSERTAASGTRELDEDVAEITRENLEAQLIANHFFLESADVRSTYERARIEHLLLHSALLTRHLDEAERQIHQQSEQIVQVRDEHSAIQVELLAVRSNYEAVQARLVETTSSLSVSQAKEEALKKELESAKAKSKADVTKLEQQLKQEKDVSQKLATVVQTSKAAEEALRDEITLLTADLAEAEKYQEAYGSLIEEVDGLVERNALAEDEAQRLSKFNAEILGHHNPAQRIMYVDRIREELHEAKLQLLAVTRERDAFANEADDLQRELGLYMSVVPMQSKPRTAVTRVARAPLANQNMNTSGRSSRNARGTFSTGSGAKRLEVAPELEYREGDMTVDELM